MNCDKPKRKIFYTLFTEIKVQKQKRLSFIPWYFKCMSVKHALFLGAYFYGGFGKIES